MYKQFILMDSTLDETVFMKLKRQLSRKSKDGKEWHRWDFTIPPEVIEKLNWKDGDEFDCKVVGKKLIIEKIL